MKYILLFFILICNTSLLICQDKIYFDDNWEKTDESNASYYRQVTGKNNLFFIQDFFVSNELQFEGTSWTSEEPFNLEGDATWYYIDGKISQKGTYKNNKLTGEYLVYYSNGQLRAKGIYIDGGILHGEYTEYFSNGGVANHANFVNGKMNGTHTKYFSKDKLEFKIDYKHGAVHGNYEKYNYYGGSLLYKGSAANNRQDGECLEYYYETIVSKYNVEEGYLHGTLREYTREGKEVTVAEFDKGVPIKYHSSESTDDGTVVAKMELVDSIEVWKTYLDDKLIAESFYTKGLKSGVWKIYTPSGLLYETQDYTKSECSVEYRQSVSEKFAPFFFMRNRFDLTDALFADEDCENLIVTTNFPNYNWHPLFLSYRMHKILKAADKIILEKDSINSDSKK